MKFDTSDKVMAYIRKVGPTLSTQTPKMEIYKFAMNIRPWLRNQLSRRNFATAAYYYGYSQLLLGGPRHEVIELATTALDLAFTHKMTRIFALANALLIWALYTDKAARKQQLIDGMRACKSLAMAWNASNGVKAHIANLYNNMLVANDRLVAA